MNIALIGYGKMGKEIEKIALERGHNIGAKINSEKELHDTNWQSIDVAIDFSTPEAVLNNIYFLIEQRIPGVIGTTGWNHAIEDVSQKVDAAAVGMVHASNFSLGVNLFFELNEQLAQLMASHQDYNVSMEETHHTEKRDAPSGTAITLAEGIMQQHSQYEDWFCPQGDKVSSHADRAIQIDAIREADVKGTHKIAYNSPIDSIKIEHEAHNRKGFALGAVIAAEWIPENQGLFTMRDVLKNNN